MLQGPGILGNTEEPGVQDPRDGLGFHLCGRRCGLEGRPSLKEGTQARVDLDWAGKGDEDGLRDQRGSFGDRAERR